MIGSTQLSIISAKMVERIAVEEGKRIFMELNAKVDSELAKSLNDDIRDAFEGLEIELNLKFKEQHFFRDEN